MKIIDLTITMDNECMTCGTPWHQKVSLERMGRREKVGRNTSRIVLGSHSGTHMDAPLHFFDGRYGIDQLDLSKCVGEITCVDFSHKEAGSTITLDDLSEIKITERMLFVFGWFKHWKTAGFYEGFPSFSLEAAQYLVKRGMKLIAMDTPSPDDGGAIYVQGEDDSPIHKYLLSNEVVIVEYLTNTDKINFYKKYKIFALPLKLKDVDGSPARVILEEE